MSGQHPCQGAHLIRHESIGEPTVLNHIVLAVNHVSPIRIESNHTIENAACDLLGSYADLLLNVSSLTNLLCRIDAHRHFWLSTVLSI